MKITNRFTNAVIFENGSETRCETVIAAVAVFVNLRDADLRDANLSGANLSGANLSGANLSDANLRDANLSDANLRGADLRDADLRGADLRGANLCGAYMSGANLSGADLRDADLRGADLRGADLRGANLCDANLRGAYMSGANLSGAEGLPKVEKININRLTLAAIEAAPTCFNMELWHSECGTAHCRAGWAVVIHPQGKELEEKYDTNAAAALIYNAAGHKVPDWYTDNATALTDIKNNVEL